MTVGLEGGREAGGGGDGEGVLDRGVDRERRDSIGEFRRV